MQQVHPQPYMVDQYQQQQQQPGYIGQQPVINPSHQQQYQPGYMGQQPPVLDPYQQFQQQQQPAVAVGGISPQPLAPAQPQYQQPQPIFQTQQQQQIGFQQPGQPQYYQQQQQPFQQQQQMGFQPEQQQFQQQQQKQPIYQQQQQIQQPILQQPIQQQQQQLQQGNMMAQPIMVQQQQQIQMNRVGESVKMGNGQQSTADANEFNNVYKATINTVAHSGCSDLVWCQPFITESSVVTDSQVGFFNIKMDEPSFGQEIIPGQITCQKISQGNVVVYKLEHQRKHCLAKSMCSWAHVFGIGCFYLMQSQFKSKSKLNDEDGELMAEYSYDCCAKNTTISDDSGKRKFTIQKDNSQRYLEVLDKNGQHIPGCDIKIKRKGGKKVQQIITFPKNLSGQDKAEIIYALTRIP